MALVLFYSILLIAGMIVSQSVDIEHFHGGLVMVTGVCLSYIMIEVGLDFDLDKQRLKSYGVDFIYAFLAAVLPWILCSLYLIWAIRMTVSSAFFVGVFSAPTSAGVLLAMLTAAGLGSTWVFRKVQVLAVFDDIVALLLLVFLQVFTSGLKPVAGVSVFLLVIFLWLAYSRLHSVKLPLGRRWLVIYGAGVAAVQHLLHSTFSLEVGVIVPAFALGAILVNRKFSDEVHDRRHASGWSLALDRFMKGLFMFLVGCSLPQVEAQGISWGMVAMHVAALTVLSNLGKCFLFFCYRKEAAWRTRLALSIAMFPRGEVGAGVLLMAMGCGLSGLGIALPVLSLAFNLLLTGVFIAAAIALMNGDKRRRAS